MMGLIEKIEAFINKIILSIFNAILIGLKKITPKFIFRGYEKYLLMKERFKSWIKQIPTLIYNWAHNLFEKLKSSKENSNYSTSALKDFLLSPFQFTIKCLNGLSTLQALLLITFTSASILAFIGIYSAGKKIALMHEADRSPASAEPEAVYDRPEYYKKELRHLDVSNLRLPVFFSDINQLKSVDIDFTATISNRYARMYLEKQELNLRDHLILQIEPLVPSFPLEDEGKDIIRKKLKQEIDQFLIKHEVEGKVIEVNITYVLAN